MKSTQLYNKAIHVCVALSRKISVQSIYLHKIILEFLNHGSILRNVKVWKVGEASSRILRSTHCNTKQMQLSILLYTESIHIQSLFYLSYRYRYVFFLVSILTQYCYKITSTLYNNNAWCTNTIVYGKFFLPFFLTYASLMIIFQQRCTY